LKARVHTAFTSKAGDHLPGDTVEGDMAIRLVTAGYAVPLVEERVQKADKPNKAVETR
jgi:hypothetical protein